MKLIFNDFRERCEKLTKTLLKQETGTTVISLDLYKNLVEEWYLLVGDLDNFFLADKNNRISENDQKFIQASFTLFLYVHNKLNHEIPNGLDDVVGKETSNRLLETVKLFNNHFITK